MATIVNNPLLSSKDKTNKRTSAEIAEKWNACLPIRLLPKTVEENPEFINLLSVIGQHVGADGTSVAIQQDSIEAKMAMEKEKQIFIQSHILYSELEDLLLDHELQLATATPSASTQFYRSLRDLLTSAELLDYIDDNGTTSDTNACSTSLLGLKPTDLPDPEKNTRLIESVQQRVIPDIECRLRRKCESLVEFYESSPNNLTSTADTGDKLTFAKATQLPALLEAESLALKSDEQKLKDARRSHIEQVALYYQILMDSLSVVMKLLTEHRLKSQASSDDITSEWLAARCEAMRLKLKVLELQLLNDTYTAETSTALNTIRRELNLSIDDTQKELVRSTEALKTYEAVGAGFDSLVQQFAKLRAEVDNKKWALQELRKHEQVEDVKNE